MLDAKQTRMHEAYSPAELQFISIEKQAVIGKVTLDGEPDMPVMSPTGEFIYLLEKGYPSHNPGQNINGRIHIVSLNDMKIAAVLDAGSDPKIALLDDAAGQTLILSKGPPVKAHGEIVDAELRVIRGASIASLLKVGNGPRHLSFSPDRRRLYVTSSVDLSTYNGLSAGDPTFNTTVYPGAPGPSGYPSLDLLTAIDYTSLKVLGQMHLDGAVSEVAFTPDGTLGFALDPKSSQMLVLDLQALKTGALVTTGRFNIKADEFILSTFEAAASIWFTPAIVVFTASNHYAFPSANTLMSVRPDGAFVYVLNHSTSDVTVVNTRTSSIIDMIAAGGRRLQPLNGGGVLAVVGRDSLHRIDTSSQKALSDVHFGSKLLDLSFSPDGRTALALVEGSVVLLNGSTGEVRSRIEGFNRPRTIVFAQPGGAPGASTQP
jgi:YVTN family beta-propeller protein